MTPTSASSATALAVPSALTRRFSRAACSGVSGAGVSPSSSGTAPFAALRENRTPSTAVARPVITTAPTAASLATARSRSRGDSIDGRASSSRAPAQPATIAVSESAFTHA